MIDQLSLWRLQFAVWLCNFKWTQNLGVTLMTQEERDEFEVLCVKEMWKKPKKEDSND